MNNRQPYSYGRIVSNVLRNKELLRKPARLDLTYLPPPKSPNVRYPDTESPAQDQPLDLVTASTPRSNDVTGMLAIAAV